MSDILSELDIWFQAGVEFESDTNTEWYKADDVRAALSGKVVVDLDTLRTLLVTDDIVERTNAFARLAREVEKHGPWNPLTRTWDEPGGDQ